MKLTELTHLLAYHHWPTTRLLGALGRLPADALAQPIGGSFGTASGLLQHILGAEAVWMQRLRGHSPPAFPDLTSCRSASDFQAAWNAVQTEQHTFISGLTNEQIPVPVRYVNFRGETWTYPLDAVLVHLMNHGTYHRGQLAHVIRQLGETPPATDYLVFVNEISTPPYTPPS